MNVYVLVEPVICLHRKYEEVTKVNVAKYQWETHLRDIQFQLNMDSYTGTMIVMYAIVMDIFPINDQIKIESN